VTPVREVLAPERGGVAPDLPREAAGDVAEAAVAVRPDLESHWEAGRRPVAIAVSDGRGHELARDSRIGSWFRQAQRSGLAPPANGLNRRWLLVPLAVLLGAFVFVFWWRRARSAATR